MTETELIRNPKLLIRREKERKWVEELLIKAQDKRWYGNITIQIKNGMIDIVKCGQTFKPMDKINL